MSAQIGTDKRLTATIFYRVEVDYCYGSVTCTHVEYLLAANFEDADTAARALAIDLAHEMERPLAEFSIASISREASGTIPDELAQYRAMIDGTLPAMARLTTLSQALSFLCAFLVAMELKDAAVLAKARDEALAWYRKTGLVDYAAKFNKLQ